MKYVVEFLRQELETREPSLDERYINAARQALAEAVKAKKLMEDLRKQVMHHAALHGDPQSKPHGPVVTTGSEDPRVLDLRAENDRLRDLVRRLADYISCSSTSGNGVALIAEAGKELNR